MDGSGWQPLTPSTTTVAASEMACLDDEYSWSPPSEAELKVIAARSERNNKISSIMGQYLLKGYKMLAITCPICDCILLEDRMTNKYCIGCSEVDADTRKDNPAVSEEAARRAVEEIQHRQNHEKESPSPGKSITSNESSLTNTPKVPLVTQSVPTSTSDTKVYCESPASKSLLVHGINLSEDVAAAVNALRCKLGWATSQLQATTSVHEAQNLSELITETCKAITALRDL
nr:protein ZNRD2-like isoform X1 [Cherax quadricarinatus]